MIQRCTNPNHIWFELYNGMMYEPWFSFEQFLEDMKERPLNTTLDRKDNNKGYSPDNCRWADTKTQQRNKNSTKLSEINRQEILSYKDNGCLIKDLAAKYNVSQSTIKNVLYRGDWA